MVDERIFVIGDIHGCLDMLHRLIKKIAWRPETDRIIFLGDYIDRGEDSKGVVNYVLELSGQSSLVECLLGNHEAMLLDFLLGVHQDFFLTNGGWKTLEGYRTSKSENEAFPMPPEHLAFYQSLKPIIKLKDYYIVHAGLRPEIDIKEQTREDMIWIRDSFINSDYDFGKKVIFGHTPFDAPLVMDNKIGLDTGAVYGNRLTCIELPGENFYSVEA